MDATPETHLPAREPIRVLHLVNWLNRGGIENWLLDFFRNADRTRLAMDVCCRGASEGVLAPQFRQTGAAVIHQPLTWNHRDFGRRLRRLLADGRYDVLHVHAGSFAGYPASIAKSAGAAAVTTFHSTSFPFEGSPFLAWLGRARLWYTRRSFRIACRIDDAVVFCSKAAERAVTDLTSLRPDSRFNVIYCGRDLGSPGTADARTDVRRELALPHDALLGIHVGTMRDPKNHAGLLRIANDIRLALPNFHLLVAGDGPLRPKIEEQIRDLNLRQTVSLLGSRDDVARLLDACDIMIFPSIWEGLPIAIIEAQMKGLPVVGSDIEPMKEATAENETSLLFPVNLEHQMARAAIELLRDRPRRAAMGRAARELARQRFSIQSNVARHLDLYRSILKPKAAVPGSHAVSD